MNTNVSDEKILERKLPIELLTDISPVLVTVSIKERAKKEHILINSATAILQAGARGKLARLKLEKLKLQQLENDFKTVVRKIQYSIDPDVKTDIKYVILRTLARAIMKKKISVRR